MLTFHHRNSSTLRVWGNRERHQHHTMRVWRQKFARSIPKLGKDRTRTTTQFLTGHSELNSRINKFEPTTRTVPKTCPHCLMEKETMNHFIGQCPKWSYQRGGYFESFYLSVTDLVDKFSLKRINGFIQATKRFTKCGEIKVWLFFLHLLTLPG